MSNTIGMICFIGFVLCVFALLIAWIRAISDLSFAKKDTERLQHNYDREQKSYARIVGELYQKIKSLQDERDLLEKQVDDVNAKLAYIYDSVENTFMPNFGEIKSNERGKIDNPS